MQTELAALERVTEPSKDQEQRRYLLRAVIDELLDLDVRLDRISIAGFDSEGIEPALSSEPTDKWASPDGRRPAPQSLQEFLAQERRYDPDLNDGVRVNISPLERAGVLASDVLGAEEIEHALNDRVSWRAAERRLVRAKKLPVPAWWRHDRGSK
jgi:hypothetical protein